MKYISIFSLTLSVFSFQSYAQCLDQITGDYKLGSCLEGELCTPVAVESMNDSTISLTEIFDNGEFQYIGEVHCDTDSISLALNYAGACDNVYVVTGWGKINETEIWLYLHYEGIDLYSYGNSYDTTKRYYRNAASTDSDADDIPAEIQVFPNPSSGAIQIALPEEFEFNCCIEVTDVMGRKVKSFSQWFSAGANTISLEDLSSGQYIVRCITGSGKNYVFKAIIQKDE